MQPSVEVGRTTKPSALPFGVLPRGLNRVAAAAYIGVGVTKFDQLVEDRRMPKPKRIDGRVLWCVRALDAAWDALPSDEDDANPWD